MKGILGYGDYCRSPPTLAVLWVATPVSLSTEGPSVRGDHVQDVSIFQVTVIHNISHRRTVWGVQQGVEDSRRLPALQAGHPRNSRKAASGVVRPQGLKRLG
jgi:hypothetical protein